MTQLQFITFCQQMKIPIIWTMALRRLQLFLTVSPLLIVVSWLISISDIKIDDSETIVHRTYGNDNVCFSQDVESQSSQEFSDSVETKNKRKKIWNANASWTNLLMSRKSRLRIDQLFGSFLFLAIYRWGMLIVVLFLSQSSHLNMNKLQFSARPSNEHQSILLIRFISKLIQVVPLLLSLNEMKCANSAERFVPKGKLKCFFKSFCN